jgi:hypothetical protein
MSTAIAGLALALFVCGGCVVTSHPGSHRAAVTKSDKSHKSHKSNKKSHKSHKSNKQH